MSARRCALYLRVSSDRQTTANQRPDVERLAEARGLEVVRVFEESASAAKRRPEFEAMLTDAHRGEFNVLVIWAIDRFGRSMAGNLADVLALDRLGVEVISVREPWMDTGGPVRQLLLVIFSWVAEQERNRLIERTRAGVERARRAGKRIGRPRAELDLDHALELRAQGRSVRSIAAELAVAPTVVHRALSSPPDGACAVCDGPVLVDMHGRARWHAAASGELCQGAGVPAVPKPSPDAPAPAA